MGRKQTQSTRDRILTEAMRLFGEQGYGATTIAEIEAAAGLRPGSGGLYRHFCSKQEILETGCRQQIASGQELIEFIDDPEALAQMSLEERFAVIARAGLRRLDQERDLNRLLARDLACFPDLLAAMRDEEIARVYTIVQGWLELQAEDADPNQDWEALAAVLVGSTAHYWSMVDIFGEHPTGVDEDRFVAAIAKLAASKFTNHQADEAVSQPMEVAE